MLLLYNCLILLTIKTYCNCERNDIVQLATQLSCKELVPIEQYYKCEKKLHFLRKNRNSIESCNNSFPKKDGYEQFACNTKLHKKYTEDEIKMKFQIYKYMKDCYMFTGLSDDLVVLKFLSIKTNYENSDISNIIRCYNRCVDKDKSYVDIEYCQFSCSLPFYKEVLKNFNIDNKLLKEATTLISADHYRYLP